MKNIPRSLLISSFLLLKFLIHLLTLSNYGLHRDEYLYLEEGRRLAWGFMEVPPVTPFFGCLAQLLGDGTFAVRIFPVLAGVIMLWLVFKILEVLQAGKTAVIFAGVSFLIAPAFLRSHGLLMPVVFEQLLWTLLAFLTLKIIKNDRPQYWYAFGSALGAAWLTKYAVVFFGISLLVGILLSPHRKLLQSRHFFAALGLALLIAAPNIFWQYNHNFPVLHHIEDLAGSQLQNVITLRFLGDQLLFFGAAALVWIAGLYGLFFNPKLRPYRAFGWAYFVLILLFVVLKGKSYYTLGIYPTLLAFGAVQCGFFFRKIQTKVIVLSLMVIINLPLIPFGAPVLPLPTMKKYATSFTKITGFDNVLIWEDGQKHDLPQDFADMTGWEELPGRVAAVYHALPPDERSKTIILAGHYGQAGVLNLRRQDHDLPEVQSFNSSYRIWQRTDTPFENMILVDDRFSMESDWYDVVILKDSIRDENARDPGYIFYRKSPKIDVAGEYARLVREWREDFGF